MKIGFTGTRQGMTEAQAATFKEIIYSLNVAEFHHGDCIGADMDAHNIVSGYCDIIIHPPINPKYRAFCKANKLLSEKEYKIRNCDIINNSDIVIGIPCKEYEVIRSGTWHALRYARKIKKPIIIIWPAGNIEKINFDK